MTRICTLLLSLLLFLPPAIAADGVEDAVRTVSQRVTEPSPDIEQMRRYVDCPVSYASGSASFSVPLVELKTPDCGVSLSLSYRCDAKKADEPAGYVGLGWTLTGLGSISRQICGLPDDSSLTPLEFHEYNNSIDYFIRQQESKIDAIPDKYTLVTPDGQSVSFLMLNDNGKCTVKLLGYSELSIHPKGYSDSRNCLATEKFIVSTPEGFVYEYAEQEEIEYHMDVEPKSISSRDTKYNAVTAWHLTKIVSPERSDSIVISYTNGMTWIRSRTDNLDCYSYSWSGEGGKGTSMNGAGGLLYMGEDYVSILGAMSSSSLLNSTAYTTFKNPPLPQNIVGRTGSINFTFDESDINYADSNGTANSIKYITLNNPDGVEIRRIDFDSFVEIYRRELRMLTFYGDTGLTESYIYSYFLDENSHGDIFGYSNGMRTGRHPQSILDEPDGELSIRPSRAVIENKLTTGLLHTIESSSGLITTFEYEPSVATVTDKYGLWGERIVVGTHIKSITTEDLATERMRRREFAYQGDMLNMDINYFGIDDFLSPSGTCQTSTVKNGYYCNFSMGVAFTATSRAPGMPFDNMKVYYGTVEETVSGTDLDQPVKYRYDYDLTHCICRRQSWGSGGHSNGLSNGSDPYLGIKGLWNTDYDSQRFSLIFSANPITGCFKEIYGGEPMLVGKTLYAADTDGSFRKRLTEQFDYRVLEKTLPVSHPYETKIYRIYSNNTAGPNKPDNIDDINHISHGAVYADIKRIINTGKIVTRYYPGGKARTTSIEYDYRIDGSRPFPGFQADSIKADSLYFRPRGITSTCNGESLSEYRLYSNDIQSRFYDNIGICYLPVARKWVVRTPGCSDSIQYDTYYSKFGTLTRMSMETVSRKSTLLDRINYTEYNAKGMPTEMQVRDGTCFSMSWNNAGQLSMKYTRGYLLQTRTNYKYLPLVGCSEISYPNGRKRFFDYSNCRLTSVKDTDGNLLKSYSYHIFSTDRENSITAGTATAQGISTNRTVYDGYGMPISEISEAYGCDGEDVEICTDYDALDRPIRKWQPLPVGDTGYYNDSRPFTDNVFDTDGSDNILAVTAPGDDIDGRPATNTYECNTGSGELACRLLSISGSTLTVNGYRPEASLDVVQSTDGDGRRTLSFIDWRGNTVLTRTVLKTGVYADTYTVCNPWGDPLLVLQPEGSAKIADGSYNISDGNMDDLIERYAFVYSYDDALRPVYTKIPGVDPVTTAYDPDGLVAYTVDGNLRALDKCRFTLYNNIAQPVMTGICDQPVTVPHMRASFKSGEVGIDSTGYVVECTLSNIEVHTVTYYNNYLQRTRTHFADMPQDITGTSANGYGMVTASLERVMDSSPRRYAANLYYYDKEGRQTVILQTFHTPGVCLVTKNGYNVDGTLSQSVNRLIHPSGERSDSHVFTYDKAGRLLSESIYYGIGTVSVLRNLTYNRIGLPQTEYNGAFTDSFGYNVRGMMTSRQSDVFSQSLMDFGSYSGKITFASDRLASTSTTHGYGYDGAGRLIGDLLRINGAEHSTTYAYDLNGNIRTLTRKGNNGTSLETLIDDLTYTYDGNRLVKVDDKADAVISEQTMNFTERTNADIEYTYDANGNMLSDLNKGMVYTWNTNNMLSSAVYRLTLGATSMVYTATGRRLNRKYSYTQVAESIGETIGTRPWKPSNTTVTNNYDTYGPYEYTDGKFSRFNTSTGYVDSLGIHAYVHDWQGNIRAVARRDSDGKLHVEQTTHYYPFGLPMGESTDTDINRYKFTGKELITEKSLNLYDYGARYYDPAICRWLSPDPMAAKYTPLSPYAFCGNNPVSNVDLDGRDHFLLNERGELLSREFDDSMDIIDMQIEKSDGSSYKVYGPSFEAGTIESYRQYEGVEGSYDVMQIRGDENGKEIFEFLSDNGSVEFAHFQTREEGDKGLNFIATGHQRERDFGGGEILRGQLQFGYTIRTWSHNHPSNSLNASDQDIVSRDKAINLYLLKSTTFHLYAKKYKKYHDYTKDTKKTDL